MDKGQEPPSFDPASFSLTPEMEESGFHHEPGEGASNESSPHNQSHDSIEQPGGPNNQSTDRPQSTKQPSNTITIRGHIGTINIMSAPANAGQEPPIVTSQSSGAQIVTSQSNCATNMTSQSNSATNMTSQSLGASAADITGASYDIKSQGRGIIIRGSVDTVNIFSSPLQLNLDSSTSTPFNNIGRPTSVSDNQDDRNQERNLEYRDMAERIERVSENILLHTYIKNI